MRILLFVCLFANESAYVRLLPVYMYDVFIFESCVAGVNSWTSAVGM